MFTLHFALHINYNIKQDLYSATGSDAIYTFIRRFMNYIFMKMLIYVYNVM